MASRILYLAAYDIAEPRRQRKALRILRDYATGGQKSVFECYLTDTEKKELETRIHDLINHEEDRFFIRRLSSRRSVYTLGIGVVPVDPRYFYFG